MGLLFSKPTSTPTPTPPTITTPPTTRRGKKASLDALQYCDTKPYIPPISTGKVIKVYDGDTITIATYIHDLKQPYRFSVRLDNIDTPEIRTRNNVEKRFATIIRDKLSDKIMGKTVRLSNVSMEKYGRILATVTLEHEQTSINDWMLQNRYAVQYGGGTKNTFDPKDFAIRQ